ncbi:MAG: hypothetical protein ACJ8FU_14235 [Xanthobacteraceae bacterium]|jgi:hypothetical protein
MKIGRSMLLGTLGLIASPFFADAQEVTDHSTAPQSAVKMPTDATAAMRALLAEWVIRDATGLAENAYDFNAPDGVPGFGPMDSGDRRLARVGRE